VGRRLAIVKPATVIAWHRRGFARFWAYKSRPRGRPPLSAEVIELVERMTRENPTWSRRRIAAELAKLGHDVSKDTVAKYMPKRPGAPGRPPSTTWGTFLRTHLAGTIAIDFLTVPTVTFNVLYVFFVLSLDRPADYRGSWPRCYGGAFDARLRNLGIEQLRTAPRSPWQNGFAERWVGTLRRELLDHVIVLGERHLLHLVRDHARYYNEDRPHMSLDGDAPVTREIEPRELGKVVALPRVSGLHHRYVRRAA
jgi:putative transposase